MNERAWVEAKVKADEMLAASDAALLVCRNEIGEEERELITRAMREVREAASSRNLQQLQRANSVLDHATQNLAALVLRKAIGSVGVPSNAVTNRPASVRALQSRLPKVTAWQFRLIESSGAHPVTVFFSSAKTNPPFAASTNCFAAWVDPDRAKGRPYKQQYAVRAIFPAAIFLAGRCRQWAVQANEARALARWRKVARSAPDQMPLGRPVDLPSYCDRAGLKVARIRRPEWARWRGFMQAHGSEIKIRQIIGRTIDLEQGVKRFAPVSDSEQPAAKVAPLRWQIPFEARRARRISRSGFSSQARSAACQREPNSASAEDCRVCRVA